jgi:hypothetical protein
MRAEYVAYIETAVRNCLYKLMVLLDFITRMYVFCAIFFLYTHGIRVFRRIIRNHRNQHNIMTTENI